MRATLNYFLMVCILVFLGIIFTRLGFAADAAVCPGAFVLPDSGIIGWILHHVDGLDQLIAGMVALMSALKSISWALGKVSLLVGSKWLGPTGQVIARLISYLAWALGVFGVGNMPKSVKYTPPFKLPTKPG